GGTGTGGNGGSGTGGVGTGSIGGDGNATGAGGTATGGGGVGGEIQPVEYLEVRTPRGVDVHQMMFAAQGSQLAINDRVRLYKFGTSAMADVSSIGTPGTSIRTNIGVDTQVGNVYSQLDVELRSRGSILGNLVTGG